MAKDTSKTFASAYQMYARGEHRGARGLLEAALRDKPGDGPSMFLMGVLDLEEGAMEAGARRLDEAAKAIQPKAKLAHRAGRLFFEHKDLPRAEKWLAKAAELNPSEPASHFWLGNVLRLKGSFRGAERELKISIDLAPTQARGYVALAYLYREQGDLKKAAETMMILHARGPKAADAQEKIAGFLIEIERPDLAEKVLTKLLPQKNEDSAFLVSLGRLRQKLGMFREAGQVYRRAIIRDANADAAYLGLSVVKKFESPDDPDAVILRQGLD
ncbi:MAG TPA: tetratricopeptide repeat protein, partial [Sphingomonadales bacterium]|nr:tetratricopeptide repeat protein [Sphingomonadales bacterium]